MRNIKTDFDYSIIANKDFNFVLNFFLTQINIGNCLVKVGYGNKNERYKELDKDLYKRDDDYFTITILERLISEKFLSMYEENNVNYIFLTLNGILLCKGGGYKNKNIFLKKYRVVLEIMTRDEIARLRMEYLNLWNLKNELDLIRQECFIIYGREQERQVSEYKKKIGIDRTMKNARNHFDRAITKFSKENPNLKKTSHLHNDLL